MISRRTLLGAAAGAGALTLVPAAPALARDTSQNGWPIDPAAIAVHRIEGSAASVALRRGAAAAVLLHVARRWHYEIAPLDTGEGGGVTGHTARRAVRAPYETNYLSGTAIALHPAAYPVGGSEPLWPHHELIVRDILVDCDGIVAWGGDLTPAKASHFHIAAAPGDRTLAHVAARLDTSRHAALRGPAAGAVGDPGTPERRDRARRLPRPR
ncbi:hypothetical protein [Phytohabitans houttuyneae]|uniref:Peptidase M15C domain-containing protein n=1 Tax=Phytohabitans houttuyneae TaxID=1076126 RepID=A0A6V8KKW9_9ACTN|nr:hypothetical protein [Phytohabitans houttuyneae]GFJ82809.1 hypothetical protein Phou_069890 [Phytohabitans houttuyneae]